MMTTDRSNAVALVLVVLGLIDARCGVVVFFCCCFFILLCLVDPVQHCNHLVGENRAVCFAFSLVCGLVLLCFFFGLWTRFALFFLWFVDLFCFALCLFFGLWTCFALFFLWFVDLFCFALCFFFGLWTCFALLFLWFVDLFSFDFLWFVDLFCFALRFFGLWNCVRSIVICLPFLFV